MSKQNLYQESRNIDKTDNYFHVMRYKQKVKFNYIQSLAPNLSDGYRIYMKQYSDSTMNLESIYWELSNRKQIHQFGVHLQKLGIYKNENSFGTDIVRKVFGRPDFFVHTGLLRNMKVVEAYKSFELK
jgi:hypothetical protein